MGWEDILKMRSFRKEQMLVTYIRFAIDKKGLRTEDEFEEYIGRELKQNEKEMFNRLVENYDEVTRTDKFSGRQYSDFRTAFEIYRIFMNKFPRLREVENVLERPLTEEERQQYKALSIADYHAEERRKRKKRERERRENVDDLY
jgi:hypothetical protein